MSVLTDLANIGTVVHNTVTEGEAKLRALVDQHLPQLAELADKAVQLDGDTLVQAALAYELTPEMRAGLATMLQKLDDELKQAAAKAAAEATAAAQQPAA